jgi:hypothetical protein
MRRILRPLPPARNQTKHLNSNHIYRYLKCKMERLGWRNSRNLREIVGELRCLPRRSFSAAQLFVMLKKSSRAGRAKVVDADDAQAT